MNQTCPRADRVEHEATHLQPSLLLVGAAANRIGIGPFVGGNSVFPVWAGGYTCSMYLTGEGKQGLAAIQHELRPLLVVAVINAVIGIAPIVLKPIRAIIPAEITPVVVIVLNSCFCVCSIIFKTGVAKRTGASSMAPCDYCGA